MNEDQIFHSLSEDAMLALEQAGALANRREREISRHIMADTMSRVWNRSLLLAEQHKHGLAPASGANEVDRPPAFIEHTIRRAGVGQTPSVLS